jgi:hypothetical protein
VSVALVLTHALLYPVLHVGSVSKGQPAAFDQQVGQGRVRVLGTGLSESGGVKQAHLPGEYHEQEVSV